MSSSRDVINLLRMANSLGTFAFTDSPLNAGATVKAVHITDLRTALGAVYTTRGRTAPTYTNPTLTAATSVVRGIHLDDLRMAVRLIE